MYKFLFSLFLICVLQITHGANTVKIYYQVPGAYEVKMIWGVNDWKILDELPAGTVMQDKVMSSKLVKEGDSFVVTLLLPEDCMLDYVFEFSRKEGILRKSYKYIDYNVNNSFYHSEITGDTVIRLSPDIDKIKTLKTISLLKYSVFIFGIFTFLVLLGFLVRKYYYFKKPARIHAFKLLVSISLSLLVVLVLIRAIITDVAVIMLISPLKGLALLVQTSVYDFNFTIIVTAFFAILMLIIRKRRMWVIGVFAGIALLSVIIALANISITKMLGRPFSYQWLYYSNFLNSTDASEAIRANLNMKTIVAFMLMIFTMLPLSWLIYQLLVKRPAIVFVVIAGSILTGLIIKSDNTIEKEKMENPVMFFISSLFDQNEFMAEGNSAHQSEFSIKNKNVVITEYKEKFLKNPVKNIIVFVLESVPAEYITIYNSDLRTTPFLDSIKSSAAIFESFYAHAPATNKSLVSILCGAYPYLSFKSVSYEKPDIEWPSITGELKKSGFRTSYFNSGDNRFLGAENFLKHRSFDLIKDYRTNSCNADVFTDKRYNDENLEGTKDSCLAVNFFEWLDHDKSKPFFSMMWTYQSHYPYFPSGEMINFRTGNFSKEKYLNSIRNADKTLQMIVEGLNKRNLFQSTLIVILGDHGEAFGKHNQTGHAGGIYEENLHIPFLMINPQLFEGERISTPGGISDIAPTILSMLQKDIPEEWQGENLFSENRRKRVYFFSPFSDYLFGFRENNFKFIYNATTGKTLLFDLKTDPLELVDISKNHAEYVKEAKLALNEWIRYQGEYVNSYLLKKSKN